MLFMKHASIIKLTESFCYSHTFQDGNEWYDNESRTKLVDHGHEAYGMIMIISFKRGRPKWWKTRRDITWNKIGEANILFVLF